MEALTFHDIARVAYVVQQSALAQVGGSAGVEWDALTSAQRDGFIQAAQTQIFSAGEQKTHIISSVGGSNSAKAMNVFLSAVNALVRSK